MSVQNFTLPKPRNDDDWEIWCKKIFASIFKVPDFQRFETRGKNQKGIDLVAKLDNGSVIVVQCKRRSTAKALTKAAAEADYKASLKLKPKPDQFIIATTHDKKGLQEWALAKSNPKAEVYAWPDIEDVIAPNAALRKDLYGTADLDAIGKAVDESLAPIKGDLTDARMTLKALRYTSIEAPLAETDDFADSYVERVSDALDELDLFGVDLPKEARKYKLSVAYISLNLESGAGEQESGPQAASSLLGSGTSRRFLIRGDAGSGKSTLLKWVAIRSRGACWTINNNEIIAPVGPIVMQRLRRDAETESLLTRPEPRHSVALYRDDLPDLPPHVVFRFRLNVTQLPWYLLTPFLIRLRDCTAGKLPDICDFAKKTADLHGATPKGWEESVLKAGRGLVLLDGIDEVPPKHRAALHKRIKGLITQYPNNMYVLTTRPLSEGEPEWLDELGFQQARVAPMSRVDREACIDRWHDAVAEELTRSKGPDPRLPELPAKLKSALNNSPEIARLATNPLLCAMICALHRSRKHLPENLNELLETLCTILLYSREKETPEFDLNEFDPRYSGLSYEDRKAIVSHLAKYMVLEGQSALSRAVVKKKIGEALQSLKDRSKSDADVVLGGLLERSGMLREKTASTIDFIHNTFKEYLAAVRFLDASEVKILADNAHEAGWDNVAVFAAALAVRQQDYSEALVRRLLPGVPTAARARKAQYSVARAPAGVKPEDAKRYQRAVAAVRVAAAIRTKLSTETEGELKALRKSLFPPRTLADAVGLATAGNAVLNFVSFSPKLGVVSRMRCIRTLRLIGTPEAHDRLRAFRNDQNFEVIEELAQAIDPLEIPTVLDCYSKSDELSTISDAQYGITGYSIYRIREATRRQVTNCLALMGRGDIVQLDLAGTAMTDASTAQLARADAGLKALTTLDLGGTQVTDVGATALAAPNSGLMALTKLDLGGTQVTDVGATALAAPNSGLKALTMLGLSGTQVTDVGATALAAPNSGLKALTTLVLGGTKVADAGATALAAPDAGLKALTTLNLDDTQVTDAGAAALVAPDSGLKALTALGLGGTKVTDVGATALAAPDSGLKALTTLSLANTRLTDVGFAALAASESGLKSLTTLELDGTELTDSGLAALAEKKSGLKALTRITLNGTNVTAGGVAAIRKARPDLTIFHVRSNDLLFSEPL